MFKMFDCLWETFWLLLHERKKYQVDEASRNGAVLWQTPRRAFYGTRTLGLRTSYPAGLSSSSEGGSFSSNACPNDTVADGFGEVRYNKKSKQHVSQRQLS